MDEHKYDNWKLSNGLEKESIFTYCRKCGGEIYIGEDCIELNSKVFLHSEGLCYEEYCEVLLGTKYKIAGK